uniref:Protein lhcp translocation defect-like n=1 Tax=Tetraselmis sp. GSL018 TaxID=582737 RepID=A0A061R2L2_9CHLO|mmetsp:Transcript_13643/g.32328  ORF Transcript_13643/g.32328 Transcript_13643/m.32328 type:complete len:155 (+) Transcript_13643:131-595(+)|eukprot:CAMPEP_0177597864 /NCGR_PEP_ID=MMETSP0419_2-20121207/11971_1 /TAXON_ID=582737 /ORGANISM="Tetraselmis sp., Strain GSL018" /LENGTH=154 /DNA_ID=CAMNT_0019090127 /DNA_START=93 /DNA_END=557 /DNA_ORIENTATION=+
MSLMKLSQNSSSLFQKKLLVGRPLPRKQLAHRRPCRASFAVSAFFNFNKNRNSYNAGGSSREEYSDEDVEFYFNYMGMLAIEGTYDRMYKLMEGRHPCDVILLMAATEGDVPKLEELIRSGADLSVKDPDGKGPLDLCTKPEAKKLLEEAAAKL